MKNFHSFSLVHGVYLLLISFLLGIGLKAQVASYSFTSHQGSYEPVVGGTSLFNTSWDNAASPNINIGFSFQFNGISYTQCRVNTNGYIIFGANDTSSGSITNPISNSTNNYTGAISAFGRDLIHNNIQPKYATLGTAPNRIFVVEWINARRKSSNNTIAGNFNFQIRLHETTNLIEVVYGSTSGVSSTTNYPVQVGLRGATNADFNNRQTTSNWSSSVQGTANNATLNSSLTVFPSNGLTYRWIPFTSRSYTSAGNFSFVTHSSVTELTAEAIGGGGRGGRVEAAFFGGHGGGGGGGAYAKSKIAVNPNTTYSGSVGVGSSDSGSNPSHGTSSFFVNSSTLNAQGGRSRNGVNSTNGALGGPSATGNLATFLGGNGGNGGILIDAGGGGGGAAGSEGNGFPGAVRTGGLGNGKLLNGLQAGNGGEGGFTLFETSSGSPGNLYGAGGGGGRSAALIGGDIDGAPGANGVVVISWSQIDDIRNIINQSITTACPGQIVRIKGSNFNITAPNGTVITTTSVTVGGTATTFNAIDNFTIEFVVPEAANSGWVEITTTLGKARRNLNITTPTIVAPLIQGGSDNCDTGEVELEVAGGTDSTLWYIDDDTYNQCPQIGYAQQWQSLPFDATYHISNATVSNGILSVTTNGNDPMIQMRNIFPPKEMAIYYYISMRYRVVSGEANAVQIYYTTSTVREAIPEHGATTSVISDGEWHVANVDLRTSEGYSEGEFITGWRFDPAAPAGTDPVTIEYDYIILSSRPLSDFGSNISFEPVSESTNVRAINLEESECAFASSCDVTTVNTYLKRFTGLNNDWNQADNWLPLGIPTQQNCVVIPLGKEISINTLNASAKSVLVEGGLTIDSSGALTVQEDFINEGGEVVLKTDANLIQVENEAVSSGIIRVERLVQDMNNVSPLFDYVYWSSPVDGQKLRGSEAEGGFSPNTPYNGFMHYNEGNDYFYVVPSAETNFKSAKGYAIRAESILEDGYDKTYTFTGTPHNGLIDELILKYTHQGYNLVGNPYPSNIDADVFFGMNSDNIHSVVYLWTNNIPEPVQHGSNYNGNSYAIYNGTGGTPATSAASDPIDLEVGDFYIDAIPNGIIKVGQGFIVQAKEDSDGQPLIFANKNESDQMLRVSNPGTFYQRMSLQKDRFWIRLNSHGIANTALIGYVPGATNDFEMDYDAPILVESSDAIYTLLGEEKLLIQGREYPLNVNDVVPLGVRFFASSKYIIDVPQKEGKFTANQRILLKDKYLNKLHNLSVSPYEFESPAGEFNDRFEIIYKNPLVTNFASQTQVIVSRQNAHIVIQSTDDLIREVEILNLFGRSIYKNSKVNNLELRIPTQSLEKQVLVVRVLTESGSVKTQKIINK